MKNRLLGFLSFGYLSASLFCVAVFRWLAARRWEGTILPPADPGPIARRSQFANLDVETSTVWFYNFSRPHFLIPFFLVFMLVYLALEKTGLLGRAKLAVLTMALSTMLLLWAIYECFGIRFYL